MKTIQQLICAQLKMGYSPQYKIFLGFHDISSSRFTKYLRYWVFQIYYMSKYVSTSFILCEDFSILCQKLYQFPSKRTEQVTSCPLRINLLDNSQEIVMRTIMKCRVKLIMLCTWGFSIWHSQMFRTSWM